ncbi:helix-turn-helix transcriptional regulator [Stutzerimonas stutzeri]|uniref:helix-turn-helix transcriptional regulator n=1 Tax=Stutzerimonas stutzeri TaxID=316 RepID=UPI003D321451
MAYHPKTLTLDELAVLHALPDDVLVNSAEAAAFLSLKPNSLNWYRCYGGGPNYVRVGSKAIRYRLGDLRAYLAASNAKRKGGGQ